MELSTHTCTYVYTQVDCCSKAIKASGLSGTFSQRDISEQGLEEGYMIYPELERSKYNWRLGVKTPSGIY